MLNILRYCALGAALFMAAARSPLQAQPGERATVFEENFNGQEAAARWPSLNNSTFFMLISGGTYVLEGREAGRFAYLLPLKPVSVGKASTSIRLSVEKFGAKTGSAGLMIDVARKAESQQFASAFTLEINPDRRFRVRGLGKDEVWVSLTGDDNAGGWIKTSYLNKTGSMNLLSMEQLDDKIICRINGRQVHIINISKAYAGSPGIFLEGQIKAVADDLLVTTEAAPDDKLIQARRDAEIPTDPIAMRRRIVEQQSKLDKYEAEYEEMSQYNAQLEQYIKENVTPELRAQLDEAIANREKMKAEMAETNAELTRLREFRKQIENSNGGDQILLYADKYEAEKKKAETLEARIKQLEEENAALKKPKKK